jgi:hypothetical protein
VLSLAEKLGSLPAQVTIWGIEGLRFGAGQSISPELTDRLPPIIKTIAFALK